VEDLKVVLVGAASPQWSYTLMRDILVKLSEDKVCDAYRPVLVLEDVDEVNLERSFQLAECVNEKAGGRFRIERTTNQQQALEGARFVVTSIAVGTLEAMQFDLDIPKEYGIHMPVGDTISVGGAIRAARNIPAMLSIARDIESLGHPEAWLLNLSNPMSILCRAVTRETRVRTIGCCHEFYGGVGLLAERMDYKFEEWRDRLRTEILGVNHCGWMLRAEVDGKDALAVYRDQLAERGITGEVKRLYDSSWPDLRNQNVKMNLFLRHGILPYSGDRHNVEFFSEFLAPGTNLGADFGVLLTTAQERLVNWRGGARANMNDLIAGKKDIELKLSNEAFARIMFALLTGEAFYDVGNRPCSADELPGIPDGAVLERMMTYDARGVTPDPICTPMPEAVKEHLLLHARNIEDFVAAGVEGNRDVLVEALGRDPLMQNMQAGKIGEMVGRLLDAHRQYVHPAFF
jgi:alpha-galactosidase/6-phospho-beta-glucosidase family protein